MTHAVYRRLVLSGTVAAIAVTAFGSLTPMSAWGAERAPKVHRVEIKRFKFKPKKLDVRPGDTITWINKTGRRVVIKSISPRKNKNYRGSFMMLHGKEFIEIDKDNSVTLAVLDPWGGNYPDHPDDKKFPRFLPLVKSMSQQKPTPVVKTKPPTK